MKRKGEAPKVTLTSIWWKFSLYAFPVNILFPLKKGCLHMLCEHFVSLWYSMYMSKWIVIYTYIKWTMIELSLIDIFDNHDIGSEVHPPLSNLL